MKRVWISLIAAGLLTIAAIAPVAGQEETITLDLNAVDDSGVEGNIRLASMNGTTDVEVLITAGLEDGAVHPVHIHEGSCEELGDVAYPLNDIENGVSETEVDVAVADLLDGEHAINVHLSADEIDVYVACTDIVEGGVGGPGEDEGDASEDDEAAEDDEASEDDEAAEDDEASEDDEAAEDDDASEDDEAAEDDEDDAAEEEEEADEVEDDIVPAAGSVGGPSGDTIALMIALIAGSAMGVGVLIRRQAGRIVLRQ